MKKAIVIFFAVLMILGCLTGCKKSTGQEPGTTAGGITDGSGDNVRDIPKNQLLTNLSNADSKAKNNPETFLYTIKQGDAQ